VGFLGNARDRKAERHREHDGSVACRFPPPLMHSGLGTLLRVLGRTERPETVTLLFPRNRGRYDRGSPCLLSRRRPRGARVPLFIGAGISGAFAQIFLSWAYKYAPMALVTIFNYTGNRLGDRLWVGSFGETGRVEPVWIGASIHHRFEPIIVWRENRLAKLARLNARASGNRKVAEAKRESLA